MNRLRPPRRWTWKLLAGAAALAAALLEAESPAPPPSTEAPDSCTAGGCHEEVLSLPVCHPPLATGSCSGCHRLADPDKHSFEFPRRGQELCLFCHRLEGRPVVHEPLAKGSCLDCHGPHGGHTRALLREETAGALCTRCHGRQEHEGEHGHRPAAAGGCLACHEAHSAPHEHLLRKTPPLLCYDCHVVLAGRIEPGEIVHSPARKDCLRCHAAHASAQPDLLAGDPLGLCLSCHEPIRAAVEEASVPHGAVLAGRQCMSCHDPHAADHPALLRVRPPSLCLDCHEKPLETPRGTVAGMSGPLAAGGNLHGSIPRDGCSTCHEVHGGRHSRLLVEEYPRQLYVPFAKDRYALCFSCHDPLLASEPRGVEVTGFRNGGVNLHHLHVNRKEKGRACRACHEPHAGGRPGGVRDAVPFGNWQLPLGFRKTPTGGSCRPGCHEEIAYDREQPVRSEERSRGEVPLLGVRGRRKAAGGPTAAPASESSGRP